MAAAQAQVDQMRDLWNQQCEKGKFASISHLRPGASWDTKEFHLAGLRFVDRMVERFVDYASIEPSAATVIEIGCGVGRFVKPLACRFKEVTGVDISQNMLDVASEYCTCLPNVNLLLNDGHSLKEFERDSFDFCVSAGVFHHITHIDVILGYIREALRVVKPGGLVLFQFEGTRTEPIGSGSLGARITAGDLEDGLSGCAYRIREISWDSADAVRNIVIVLQKVLANAEDAAEQRAFTTFPMIERRWIRGVYEDIKTQTDMHRRQKQEPKRITFHD